ncbi:hypothetical protein AB4Z09_21630 [Rhodococcus sp. TAF43]|uniref:hypothetical protein n=1 Tax=unclassified Rhodococcus (in: high G+C Gram-positive bacteria) TaxID=192944 RepID=UPI0011C074A8|nr:MULTISPECIES: hypothetical protein [unclassified Rhodococcus (in: high G+C Gram-positive bacteria)]QKT09324.1 hypothetical protein HUN07_08515 [Rhodococcus sp. W8901]
MQLSNGRVRRMYNWELQNAITAFVDSLRPMAPYFHDLYIGSLHAFVHQQSELLTMLGYPPVP